jgi:hypothetical protein
MATTDVLKKLIAFVRMKIMMNPTKRSKQDASHYKIWGNLTKELFEHLRKSTIYDYNPHFDSWPGSIATHGRLSYCGERYENLHNRDGARVTISIDWEGDSSEFPGVVDELQRVIESNPNLRIVHTIGPYPGHTYVTICVGGPIAVPSLSDLCLDVAGEHLDTADCYVQLPCDLHNRFFQRKLRKRTSKYFFI